MFRFIRPVFAVSCLSLVSLVSNVSNVSADTIEAFTEPYRQVELAAGDSGIIAKMSVQAGDAVQEGQLLVSLDSRVLRATLAVAQQKVLSMGNVDVAKAELDLRRERLAQITVLRQRGHATQREFARAQTDVTVAEAHVRHAQDEIELSSLDCKRIEAQLSQREVVSPFAGVVTQLYRKTGEPTLVTDPRIVSLAQLDLLRAKFSATPSQVTNLKTGQVVPLTLAGTEKKVDGKIERISKTIDAKSGTLELHVVIDNANDRIRAGARCLLNVTADHSQNGKGSLTGQRPAGNTNTIEASLFGGLSQ